MTKTSGLYYLFIIFSVSFAFTCCSAENGQKSTENAENEQIAVETAETEAVKTCSIEEKNDDENKAKPAVSLNLMWSEPSPDRCITAIFRITAKSFGKADFRTGVLLLRLK